jgi:hypothetical protein
MADSALDEDIARAEDAISEKVTAMVDCDIALEQIISTRKAPLRLDPLAQRSDIDPEVYLYACFLPAVEEVAPTPLKVRAKHWPQIVKRFLGTDGYLEGLSGVSHPQVRRLQTVPAVCIHRRLDEETVRIAQMTAQDDPEGISQNNTRLAEWLTAYAEEDGWRGTPEEREQMKRVYARELAPATTGTCKALSKCSVSVVGDALVFLRNGEKDLEQLMEWTAEREAQLGPIREHIRTMRANMQKRRRVNHGRFRTRVWAVANKFLPFFELMFNRKHAVSDRSVQYGHGHARPTVQAQQRRAIDSYIRPVHIRALLWHFIRRRAALRAASAAAAAAAADPLPNSSKAATQAALSVSAATAAAIALSARPATLQQQTETPIDWESEDYPDVHLPSEAGIESSLAAPEPSANAGPSEEGLNARPGGLSVQWDVRAMALSGRAAYKAVPAPPVGRSKETETGAGAGAGAGAPQGKAITRARIPTAHPGETDPLLEEMFLVDQQRAVTPEDTWARFDGDHFETYWTRHADDYDHALFDRSSCHELERAPRVQASPRLHDLDPTRTQVLYAMYQIHCGACCEPCGKCRLPGCSEIRTHRDALRERRAGDESEKGKEKEKGEGKDSIPGSPFQAQSPAGSGSESADLALLGTGRHPLEVAIRAFLLGCSARQLCGDGVPLPLEDVDMGPEPYIQDLEYRADVELRQRSEELRLYLAVHWRMLERSAAQMRFLHRRFVSGPLRHAIDAPTRIEMVGGRSYVDEGTLRQRAKAQAGGLDCSTLVDDECLFRDAVPPELRTREGFTEQLSGALVRAHAEAAGGTAAQHASPKERAAAAAARMRASALSQAEDRTAQSKAEHQAALSAANALGQKEVIFEVKMKFLRAFVGSGAKLDGSIVVPAWARDPYPRGTQEAMNSGEKHPMSQVLYRHLSARLRLCPANRSGAYSFDAEPEEYYSLQFDRLLGEKVLNVEDGSLLVVQCLFGVMPRAELKCGDVSGCPTASVRYCLVAGLDNVVPGLTVAVYDAKSDVSRALEFKVRVLLSLSS